MASGYPSSIDAFPAPGAAVPMNTPGALEHDTQHANVNDAVTKIQTYLGVTGSGVVTTITNKLAVVTAQAASTASTVSVIAATQIADEANIALLLSSNPAGAAQGQVYIAPTATAGTAINAAYASFGSTPGVIQLGKGTFTLDTAVVIKNNMTIRGMGRNSTFIVFDPSTIPVAFTANPNAVNTVRIDGLRIQTTTGGNGTGTALDLGYVNYGVVTNLSIGATGAFPNKGIDFSINNNTNSPYYSVVRDSLVQVGGANPIGIDISNQANSNVIDNVRVDVPGASTGTPIGVKIGGSTRASHTILLKHVDCESVPTMTGVLITDLAYNVTMIDCYFEGLSKCVQIDAGSQNVHGYGNYFYNWSSNAVLDNSGATGGDISFVGMGTIATGAGTAFPFNYRSGTAPIVFTSNGSLTAAQTFGASALRVRVVGGGGAGGGAATGTATTASVGGGGQAGGYAEGIIPIASVTFPVTVTIGAAGTANSAAAGGNGGTSSFGTLISVSGGVGGATNGANTTQGFANGGFGGATISGAFAQIQASGNEGTSGLRFSGTQAFAGNGAGSVFGGAIIPSGTAGGTAGRTSGTVGAGGSGSFTASAVGPFAGGAGNAGVVIVEPIFA